MSLSKQLTLGLDKTTVAAIAKQSQMTTEEILSLIEVVLNEALEATLLDIQYWISRKVPKRTGQLRDTLLEKLNSSSVIEGVLKLIIGTQVDYAQRVNRMSTHQVRHSSWFEHRGKRPGRLKKRPKAKRAYAYYYGHRGRIFLDDPEAIGGFWDKLLKYMKKRALLHLKVAMQKYYGKQKKLKFEEL